MLSIIMTDEKRIIFRHINRISQREVKTLRDIKAILSLNEAHWTTTGAALDAINCDPVFIKYLDYDNNKRIMCFEVKQAIEWLLHNLRDQRDIEKASLTLRLDAINTDHKDGRDIALAASQALNRLRKTTERALTLEEVRSLKAEIEKTPLSEAGIVLPEAAKPVYLQNFLCDIIATLGGELHPNGRPGVTREKLDAFMQHCRAYTTWFQKGVIPAESRTSDIKPLGEATAEAFTAFKKIQAKVDEYFIQCRMAAFTEELGFCHQDSKDTAKQQPCLQPVSPFSSREVLEKFLATAPLARPGSKRALVFSEPVNCYYEDDFQQLLSRVVEPMLGKGKKQLTEKEWCTLCHRFEAYAQWQAEKQGEAVASIPIRKLEQYLTCDYQQEICKLIDASVENALVLDETKILEKLILYQGLIIKFLNNFVYFPYLYDPRRRALFEMGTLIMDGRKFKLSVKVHDHARHKELARNSNMFILYVNVYTADTVLYEVAIPVTAGGKGNLYIGKRGIFRDIQGNGWDAKVIEIVENPISIMEALVTPFQKLTRLINTKIEELRDVAESKLDNVVKETKLPTPQAQTTEQSARNKAGMGNLFMGSGIAIAALGSSMAFITKTISEVKWYTVIITILGALLAVLLPTFITAFNKLRKRDLSTILEASGWAVNVRMNLTFKLGKFFTQKPAALKIIKKLRGFSRVLPVVLLLTLLVLGILFRREISAWLAALKPQITE